MTRLAFRILTREEAEEIQRICIYQCPCKDAHHRGLWDGRTTCERPMDHPGPCEECVALKHKVTP